MTRTEKYKEKRLEIETENTFMYENLIKREQVLKSEGRKH